MSTTRRLISRVRTRLLVTSAVEDLQRGAAWGAFAALATLGAGRAGWIADAGMPALAAGLGVTALVPLAGMVVRRRDDHAVAAAADERLGLEERISTALWLERAKPSEGAAMGALVVSDAESVASNVAGGALGRAFRPRMLRRPVLAAAGLAAACALVLLTGGPAEAVVETPVERAARLADADRLAQVARKIRDEVKRVEAAAANEGKDDLVKLAGEIHRRTEPMTRAPAPPRDEALRQLNALADLAAEQARRVAGLTVPIDAQEAKKADRELAELLSDLSKAGLETLQKDLAALEKRLKSGEKGEGAPSADEMRDLAKRIDALRKAMERAAANSDANSEFLKKLRSVGNEELLAKIAERMRQIAARLGEGRDYSGLQGDESGEDLDLSELSEEELQEILDDLERLKSMQELDEMLRNANGELRGGRKLRLGGSGGT